MLIRMSLVVSDGVFFCWVGCLLTCYSGCSTRDLGVGLIVWKVSIIGNIRVPCISAREDITDHCLPEPPEDNLVADGDQRALHSLIYHAH
jgi:hypothetical protein